VNSDRVVGEPGASFDAPGSPKSEPSAFRPEQTAPRGSRPIECFAWSSEMQYSSCFPRLAEFCQTGFAKFRRRRIKRRAKTSRPRGSSFAMAASRWGRRHSPGFAATVASHSRRATAYRIEPWAYTTVTAATRHAHGGPLRPLLPKWKVMPTNAHLWEVSKKLASTQPDRLAKRCTPRSWLRHREY
jgi:hypothetical protein